MSDQWYVRIGEEVRGPLTRAQVLGLLAQGLLCGDDAISRTSAGPWAYVKSVFPKVEAVDTGSSSEARAADVGRKRPATGSTGSTGLARPVVVVEAASSKESGEQAEILTPAEIRRRRREERLRLITALTGVFLGVLVAGLGLVVAVHWLRGWLMAQEARVRQQTRTTVIPVQGDLVKVEENADELLQKVAVAVSQVSDETVKPAAGEQWFNAATEVARIGGLTVRVVKAEIGFGRMIAPNGRRVRFRDPCLLVTLEYSVQGEKSQIQFKGWEGGLRTADRPILADHSGRQLPQKRYPGFRLEGSAEPCALQPGQQMTDVLAFEAPEGLRRALRLSLPAEVFGGSGRVGFILPADMIIDRRVGEEPGAPLAETGEAKPQGRAAGPSAQAAKEQGLEEEDRIPIPGVGEAEDSSHTPSSESSQGESGKDLSSDPKLRALHDQTVEEQLKRGSDRPSPR